MVVPSAWERLRLDGLSGTVMVIGAPDVGKSTFAGYLYQRCCDDGRPAALLDGDPGQSRLGPPATITVATGTAPNDKRWRRFIGSVSPRGHMLPLVVGAVRLVQVSQAAGAQVVVYDTSGLVDPAQGGPPLKLAKIELLRPATVFAIQRANELESLLLPLRRSRLTRVVDLRPSPAAQQRDRSSRQSYRAARFRAHFAAARPLEVDLTELALLPPSRDLARGRLLALQDAEGFTLALGVVLSHDRAAKRCALLTPLESWNSVDSLRLGSLVVDAESFRDRPLNERSGDR